MSTTHAIQDSDEEESLLPSSNNNDTSVNSNRRVRSYDSIIRLASYRREGKWPITLWFVLSFLCVFWHRRILKKRKCYVCYVTSVTRGCDNQTNSSQSMLLDPLSLEYEYDGELWQNENDGREQRTMGNDEDVEECSVCNVTLWNYHGERTQFTDKSTGGSLWVSRCSKYISLIVLILAMASILYDLGYYIDRMWGRQNKLLHFISYNAFLVCLSIYPMMNICSKFRSFFGKKENVSFLDWAGSLNARFIIKRMQFMNLAEKGLPGKVFFTICLCWPLCNSGYRVFVYFYILRARCPLDFHAKFSMWPCGILLVWWGCFIYLVYVMRLSFQRQFMLTLSFIREHEGDLDTCRNCLSQVVIDFNSFRKLAVIYMGAMVPVTVLGITSNVTWQYRLSGTDEESENAIVERSIDILIWSNIIMFIALSLIALGGLDLNYIWDHFAANVVQTQSARHCRFWQRLLSHVRVMGGEQSVISLTLVWSVIGFYMGLHFGDEQDVHYGVSKCGEQNITQPTQILDYTVTY